MLKPINEYNGLIEFTKRYIKSILYLPETFPDLLDFEESITLGFISRYNENHNTAEWDEKYHVFEADTLGVKGYMIIRYNNDQSSAKVSLEAHSERAVRELLLSIPFNLKVEISYFERWIEKVIEEYIYIIKYVRDYHIIGIKRTHQSIHKKRNILSHGDEIAIYNKGITSLSVISKKDPCAIEFKELNTLKNRIKNEKYVIEGARLVKRTLKDGQPLDKILYAIESQKNEDIIEITKLAKELKIPCYSLTSGLMGWISDTRPVPTVIASAHIAVRDADTMHIGANVALLILDTVSNPDNLGMIIRTADASGIEAIVLIGNTTHYLNKNVIRGARGAIGRIPVFTCYDEEKFFDRLKSEDFQIVGMSSHANNEKLYEMPFKEKIAFIIGNETIGIRKEITDKCTDNIRIPMAPGQSSLNVGVATGIVLYEYVRRRYS